MVELIGMSNAVWKRQPQGVNDITPYWRTRKLVYAVNFAHPAYDVAAKYLMPVSVVGTPARVVDSIGKGIQCLSGSAYILTNTSNSLLINTGPVTHFFLLRVLSIESPWGTVFSVSGNGNHASFGLQRYSSDDKLAIYRSDGVHSSFTGLASVLSDNKIHKVIAYSPDLAIPYPNELMIDGTSSVVDSKFEGTGNYPTLSLIHI